MKRAGFTMIELIFVIVILGILAAVAIPKLAATRSDAEIAKMATNAATLVSDYGAKYTAGADINASTVWDDITNTPTETVAGTATLSTTTVSTAVLLTDGINDCVTFTPSDPDGDGFFDRLTVVTDDTGTVCEAVAARVASLEKVHDFGATGVSY
jgi:prepilin-type N-terminal cleavage/methylation domain-containing protein